MFRRRSKSPAAITAVTLIATFGLTTVALAQKEGDKTPPLASGTNQPTTASPSSGSGGKAGQTVFRPKETIAPGKPVSFPSDI